MLQQKQSLLFFDRDVRENYTLLRSLFLLLLPRDRAACTFDTFVEDCLPPVSTFWALGNTRQISRGVFLPVQLAMRSVNVKVDRENSADLGAIVYSSWLFALLQNCADLQEINEELFSAQIVAEAFLEKRALPEELLDTRTLQRVYQVNAQFIDQIVLQVVGETFLPQSSYMAESARVKRLVEEVTRVMYDSLTVQEILSIAAEATCSKKMLGEIIYNWLLNEPPPYDGWSELHTFAVQATFAPLLLMTSLKMHAKKSFSGSEEKSRENIVRQLLREKRLVPVVNELLNVQQRPAALLARRRNSSAAEKQGFELTEDEFLVLVSTIIASGNGNILTDAFVERVNRVHSKKALRELAKLTKKASGVPPAFVRALERQSQ